MAILHLYLYHRLTIAIESPPPWLVAFSEGAYYSTSIFFILSGFILTYVYSDPQGEIRIGERMFWTRRFWRLYPIHVIATLLYLPLYLMGDQQYSTAQFVLSLIPILLLVHAWIPFWPQPGFNMASWAVSALAFFYGLFPPLLRRIGRSSDRTLTVSLILVWLAYLIPPVLYVMFGAAGSPMDEMYRQIIHTNPLLRLPEFVMGMILGTIFLRHGSKPMPSWLEPTMIAANIAGVALTTVVPWAIGHNGLFTFLQAGLIYVVAGGRGTFARAFSWKPMQVLGQSSLTFFFLSGSLSVYVHKILKALIVILADHTTTVSMFRDAYKQFEYPAPYDIIIMFVVGVLTYALAVVVHLRIYHPLTERLRSVDPRTIPSRFLSHLNSLR